MSLAKSLCLVSKSRVIVLNNVSGFPWITEIIYYSTINDGTDMSRIWRVVGDTWTLISVTELVIRSDNHDNNQPPLCVEHGLVLPRVQQQDQDQVPRENV